MGGVTDYFKDVWQSIFKSQEQKLKDKEGYESAKNAILEYIKNADRGIPEKREYDDVPSYERMEYAEKSEDEIRNEAESGLKDYYEAGVNKLESQEEQARKQKEQQKLNAENSSVQKQAEIDKAFDNQKKEAAKDSLKKGVARSSIAEKQQDTLESFKNDSKNQVEANLNARIFEIDSEISSLETKQKQAMNDFNISYATKLASQINTLKKEQESKKKEALKYNNSLDSKEYNENISKGKKSEEEYKLALENYYKSQNKLDNDYYDEIFRQMDEMLSKMSKLEARKLVLEDDFFSTSLDRTRFGMLMNKYLN